MSSFKDLIVYKKAFVLAMEVLIMTKTFSKEERCSLINQIRRCSHLVCFNLGERYRTRQYLAHFVAKVSGADIENSKTQV